MRRVGLLLALVLSVAAAPAPTPTPVSDSPVGVWRTIDDATGRARGTVRIVEHDGVLSGTIESVVDPADLALTCDRCAGDRHGHHAIGLEIIRGLHRDGDRWSGGTILDPQTGDVWSCSVRVIDGGSKLVLRGYLGISLLGRSQTWLRAD